MKILIIFLSIFLLTGCHDNKETDTLATVIAVGIDMAENGKEYTFAVADTSGFGGESSGDSAPLICFSQKGKSIDRAVDALDRKLSKKLSFSHLSAIVFSKETAENGMYGDAEYFEKKISVRPQAMIGISLVPASKYLSSLKPRLETNPERYFQNMFDKNEFYVSSLRLCDFTNAYHEKTIVCAPVIRSDNEKKLTEQETFTDGSAVLKDGKLQEITEDNRALGLLLSTKIVEYDGVRCKSTEKARIKADVREKTPSVDVFLTISAHDKLDTEYIRRETEKMLTDFASKGIDIINVASYAKKEFLLQKSYDNYGFDIKKARFSLEVREK